MKSLKVYCASNVRYLKSWIEKKRRLGRFEVKGKSQIALTERQMKIVEHINLHGKISNKDVREMFKLSDEGALKEIKKLLRLGVIKRRGKGRVLHYVLK